MKEQQCSTCLWWREFEHPPGSGLCQRYPPIPFLEVGFRFSVFPKTHGVAYCGEWKVKMPKDMNENEQEVSNG